MSEDGYFTFGHFQAPLTASTANSALYDCDYTLYTLIAYYKFCFETYLQDRWNEEVVAANLPELAGSIVSYVLPYDPIPYLKQIQSKFPLLAIFPIQEEFSHKTVIHDSVKVSFQILWVMPPIEAAQAERLMPFRRAVAKTLRNRTNHKFDPGFRNGEQVWEVAGIESIDFQSASYGSIENLDTDLFLPTLQINLQLVERTFPDSRNSVPLDGADVEIDSDDLNVVELNLGEP